MSSQNYLKLPNIKLNNVRLSYPSIFQVKVWEEGKDGKYEATFILNKDTHKVEIDQINEQIDQYLKEHKVDRNKVKVDNICLKDGDMSNTAEYQNSYTIKGTSTRRFPIVNKDGKTPIASDDNIIYGGCYVSAYIDLWVYSKPNTGIACNLLALQFVNDGESFGAGSFDISGKFDAVESTNAVDDMGF